jgi:hypothetical protein
MITPPDKMPECSVCDAPATGMCDACFFFIYCGRACQRAHWGEHQLACVAIQRDAATPLEPHGADFYPNPPNCHGCGVPLNDRVALCTGCEFAGYCSEPCQLAHWDREHGDVCALVREAKDARRARAAADAAAEAARVRAHALRRAHVSLDVGMLGAVETVGALRDFPEDAALAVKALTALRVRIDKQMAINAGSAAVIVAAMSAHAIDSTVAYHGCWALTHTAEDPTGIEAAIDAGATVTIVAAMRAHANVRNVAFYGCSALLNISTFFERQAVINAGAPVIIVAAMRAHVSDSGVAQYGCRAFVNIACEPAGQLAAFNANAVATIVATMRAHKNVANVALYGCWALALIALIAKLVFSQQAAVTAGAPAAIIAAMRVHLTDKDVAYHGCGALVNITQLPDGKQAAIDAGAPAAIVAAMRKHAGDSDVAHYGCWALSNIVDKLPQQEAAGAPGAIISAMRAHAGVSQVALYGCQSLVRIAALPAG